MKKFICMLLTFVIIMSAIPAFAEDFPGFSAQKLYMGSVGSNFRVVVDLNRVEGINPESLKNKKIEVDVVSSGQSLISFESTVADVEVQDTRWVVVVPSTENAKVNDVQGFVNDGARLNIRILNDKGEAPETAPVTPADKPAQTPSENSVPSVPANFEAFTVEGIQTGMAGTSFRFVVPASKLPIADAEIYKNKKIEYTKLLNGNEENFVSVITSVEARKENTEFVLVVSEAKAGDAKALKEFQNAGGNFRIKVYPVAGEKPKVDASDVQEPVVTERPKSDVDFASLPDYGNIFAPYLTKKAPEVLETKSVTTENGIVTKEIFYSSYDGNNKIFARIFSPDKSGKFPGVVLYHGGAGYVDNFKDLALHLAANDYVVITPELPGIGDPQKMLSEGPFKQLGYSQQAQIGRIKTDPRDSSIYQGVISAIDAVYLLKSLENVDNTKTGISGGSWGGYTTTKIAGLLGNDIVCAYSRYGCAYYDAGTHWSKNVFPNFAEISEKLWMKYLDASVDIANLSAAYFIEAPTNDEYFFPDAVQKTLDNIKGDKNKVFTANMDHVVHSDHFTQALGFFDYYLKNSGKNLVTASGISAKVKDDGAIDVTFNVPADRKISAELIYADANVHWNEKQWKRIAATVNNGVVTAVLPPHLYFENTVLYGYVTDENKFYASTDMVTLNGLAPKTLTDEEMLKFLGDTIVVNETDPETAKKGTWAKSSLTGYEDLSVYASGNTASITYTPLVKAGKYKVSAFIITHERNQTNVKATINHANGTDEKLLSTNIPKSDWVEIGEFEFKTGRSGNVILSAGDDSSGESNPIRLDAVKFELIEEAEDPNEIKVILNGTKLKFPEDQLPVIIEGRTMVAFRTIFEALGLSVGWNQETATAMGEKEGMKIELPIGNTVATVNGVQKTTDVPAQLINSRTFVPLRFLSEALGFTVSWDGETKTVTITEQ